MPHGSQSPNEAPASITRTQTMLRTCASACKQKQRPSTKLQQSCRFSNNTHTHTHTRQQPTLPFVMAMGAMSKEASQQCWCPKTAEVPQYRDIRRKERKFAGHKLGAPQACENNTHAGMRLSTVSAPRKSGSQSADKAQARQSSDCQTASSSQTLQNDTTTCTHGRLADQHVSNKHTARRTLMACAST